MAKMCTLCYSTAQQVPIAAEGNLHENLEHSLHFQEFCKAVNVDPQLLLGNLEIETTNAFLCRNCLNTVKKAVSVKVVVDETEKEINRLQAELLEQSGIRDSAVETWHGLLFKLGKGLEEKRALGTSSEQRDGFVAFRKLIGEAMGNASDLIVSVCDQEREEKSAENISLEVIDPGFLESQYSQNLLQRKRLSKSNRFGERRKVSKVHSVVNHAQERRATVDDSLHVRFHTGQQPHKCGLCEKSFTRKSNLNVHMGKDHPSQKLFVCNHCQKRFAHRSSLLTHNKSHAGEKLFPCLFCKAKFPKKSVLEKHILSHTQEKPLECCFCEYTCSVKTSMEVHILRHTGEKPFPCQVCARLFRTPGDLKQHQITHKGYAAKPHGCVFCEARFTAKIDLESHTRTHTLEKPFSCGFCGNSFARSSHLKRHTNRMHSD